MNEQQNDKTLLIADMDLSDRPREKAMRHGIKSLSDAELMAIVFATGIKGKSVVQMCNEILAEHGGHVSRIAELDAREFMRRYKGIGPAKALTLLAALELGKRSTADAARLQSLKLSSSQSAAAYMHPVLSGLDHEEFWIVMLRRNLTPLRKYRIGQGGQSATVVDVKLLAKEVLLSGASSVMLFHNHPSGESRPSLPDIELTNKISAALRLFDIPVLDHLILANGFEPSDKGAYYSFHDNGKI